VRTVSSKDKVNQFPHAGTKLRSLKSNVLYLSKAELKHAATKEGLIGCTKIWD
jgi:hypothetical protein